MPITRSQGLPAKEAPEKTKVPTHNPRKGCDKNATTADAPQTQLPNSVAESPLFRPPPELSGEVI
jgi:hypothetical protein